MIVVRMRHNEKVKKKKRGFFERLVLAELLFSMGCRTVPIFCAVLIALLSACPNAMP